MHNLSLSEIAGAGETHMEKWLQKNGFKNIISHTKFIEIEADGKVENILIHVQTTLASASQDKILDEVKTKFIVRAARLQRVAYVAYVVIDENKGLSKEIAWEKLRLLE